MFCNKRTKKAISVMRDFVEGKINTLEFWEIYKNNTTIQNILKNDKYRRNKEFIIGRNKESFMPQNADNALNSINIMQLADRVALFMIVKRYFWYREKIKYYNSDEEYCKQLDSIIPEWVGDVDCEFIISKINDIGIANKSLCKKRINEIFTYKSHPPKWVQEPEWPIIDGVPYVFSHQETAEEGYKCYYFYDPNDKTKTVVIDQCE